jgi:hypothetical protein
MYEVKLALTGFVAEYAGHVTVAMNSDPCNGIRGY